MTASALNSETRRKAPVASLDAIPAKDFSLDHARHLLSRAGFGGSPAQIRILTQWGLDRSVDSLVNFGKVKDEPVPDTLFRSDIMRPPTAEERTMQRRAAASRDEDTLASIRLRRQQAEREDRGQIREMQLWWLKKMIETSRPLQEKLTLFWHGHFATSYRTIEDSYHMFQQNQLFREHATGSFKDLLHGIIKDPAMLAYLDNNDSRKNRPNENLARELMELFSLGVGNYTERDIKEGARALTGYTFSDDKFRFEKNNHDESTKTILGKTGAINGEGFVDIILAKPACAEFICTKLYRYFVHNYPTGNKAFDESAKRVIMQMADRFRGNGYDIAKTLTTLFRSQHFYDQAIRAQLIKSPVDVVVGTVRTMNAPPRDLSVLLDALDRMGQHIFMPPSVKGWDGGRSWINTSTMFVRQNIAVFLLTGQRIFGRDGLSQSESFDVAALLDQIRGTYTDAVGSKESIDALLRFTLGRTDPAGRKVLDDYIASRGGTLTSELLSELLLLITATPEYQLC
jgi:hypothetical protein